VDGAIVSGPSARKRERKRERDEHPKLVCLIRRESCFTALVLVASVCLEEGALRRLLSRFAIMVTSVGWREIVSRTRDYRLQTVEKGGGKFAGGSGLGGTGCVVMGRALVLGARRRFWRPREDDKGG